MDETEIYSKTWRALRRNTIILIAAFLFGYPMIGLWLFVPSTRFYLIALTVPWLLILSASLFYAASIRCPRCGERLLSGRLNFKARGLCGNCGLTLWAMPPSKVTGHPS
jgi:ribosomal protein S27AE